MSVQFQLSLRLGSLESEVSIGTWQQIDGFISLEFRSKVLLGDSNFVDVVLDMVFKFIK